MRIRDDQGASAVEYGLLVFAIAAVIAAVVFGLGRVTGANYQSVCNELDTAAAAQTCS